MTEAEWLACADGWKLTDALHRQRRGWVWRVLEALGVPQSRWRTRKDRLFACAFCRHVWPALAEAYQRAVEVAEQHPDTEFDAQEAESVGLTLELPTLFLNWELESLHRAVWYGAPEQVTERSQTWQTYNAAYCDLFRDVHGNPFRRVALDRAWRTPTVTGLATAAYDNCILPAGTLDLDRLAVLADSLEDAGCDNADLLSHLRGSGPHVRGCWVVDLLLGKE
jgi:hypothetical protein